jgi:DNA polymerase II large subunit
MFRFGFRRGDDGSLEEAFETLDAEMVAALARPKTLIEVERQKSDELMDELRGREMRLAAQIEAFEEELRQVRKVLKAEILRTRELDTDGGYSPELDNLGSHAVAIETKRQRGDKHFSKPAKEASAVA